MKKNNLSSSDQQKSGRKFVIVGVGNTILDFGLMNIFSRFLPLFLPNFLSTGIAMLSSFYFNKKWTFGSKSKSRKALRREIIMFFVFTIIGIWLIQTPLMYLIIAIFPHGIRETLTSSFGNNIANFLIENFAKVIASVFSLTWNFTTYKRFVFAKNEIESAEQLEGL